MEKETKGGKGNKKNNKEKRGKHLRPRLHFRRRKNRETSLLLLRDAVVVAEEAAQGAASRRIKPLCHLLLRLLLHLVIPASAQNYVYPYLRNSGEGRGKEYHEQTR